LRLLEREEAGLADLLGGLRQGLAQAEDGELADGTGTDAIRRAFSRARSQA
jgi:antitoxin ParD1/3/4